MDNWFEFALERYNYWIVITLMMTGLYIVFARGNLVKKVVGLNLFQTSVFIFYITIGKIAGGTAPIYVGGELEHGGDHGDGGHGDGGHGEGGHSGEGLHAAPDGAVNATPDHGEGVHETGSALHAKIENTIGADAVKSAPNTFEATQGADVAGAGAHAAEGLHASPGGDLAAKISNDALQSAPKTSPDAGFEVAGDMPDDLHHGDGANVLADAPGALGEVLYTNPLPHVLILTAIVVGVATTAVGLALAVRIREAYGTIEEDELEAIDNIAEFGETEGGLRGNLAGGRA